MSEFIEAFKSVANKLLKECPKDKYEWFSEPNKPKETLKIYKLDDNGFDFIFECESYGLYVYSDGWRGSPWDVTTWPIDEFKQEISSFIKSILSGEAELLIRYTNGKPYRWILKAPFYGELHNQEVGSLFYNYFGKKTERIFRNSHVSANKTLKWDV